MARKQPKPADAPVIDAHALIARLRAGDEAAFAEAYRITFGGDLGRLVLVDICAGAGVGQKYGGAPDLWSTGYHHGGHDLALDILTRAGFDQASAITMVMTEQLEGSLDEPGANAFAEHDPDFADDDER